jgi:hypothetical protein
VATYKNVKGMPTSYTTSQIDGLSVMSGDKKVLFRTDRLAATAGIDAKWYLIDSSGKRWDVVTVSLDPADAMWTVQVR